MVWLAKFLTPFLKPALDWIFNKIQSSVEAYIRRVKDEKRIESLNKAIREKTEKAETREERAQAARDSINSL